MPDSVKLIECPRDAWQGLEGQIPADLKTDYLRALISVGFKHIDAVSFVGLGQVFVANMTGNVVFIGFALAGAEGFSFARSLAALAAFAIQHHLYPQKKQFLQYTTTSPIMHQRLGVPD